MGKTTRRYKKRDHVAATVARIHGVSYRYVQMVRDGEREDEEITATLVDYTQGERELIESLQRSIVKHANYLHNGRKKN
ncbi:hypothetical protein [Chryseosolibacter indicus]|uniref:Transposase n=1 Tax=Chryseosolibacter indicus TaxID=2782351 RepID=A0ABS5VQ59_9BACT|nr:hypothetical protein [Chryseosolibacter indicus]MBT1702922.1 hypothetical protein [Chryseosolibacter indicus]